MAYPSSLQVSRSEFCSNFTCAREKGAFCAKILLKLVARVSDIPNQCQLLKLHVLRHDFAPLAAV